MACSLNTLLGSLSFIFDVELFLLCASWTEAVKLSQSSFFCFIINFTLWKVGPGCLQTTCHTVCFANSSIRFVCSQARWCRSAPVLPLLFSANVSIGDKGLSMTFPWSGSQGSFLWTVWCKNAENVFEEKTKLNRTTKTYVNEMKEKLTKWILHDMSSLSSTLCCCLTMGEGLCRSISHTYYR